MTSLPPLPSQRHSRRQPQPVAQFLRELRITVAFMVALAALVMLVPGFGFWHNLGYTLAIGLSIHVLSFVVCLARRTAMDWKTAVVAIPLGTGVGLTIGSLANGSNPLALVGEHPTTLALGLAVSLVVGSAISYYFYSRGVIAEAEAERQRDQSARAAQERALAEANLRLLQAQIEPHFLFNTLANVHGLIRDDADKAERMLEDFIAYLRLSLKRTRAGTVTLADELTLVRAYLDIQSVRMGDRLRYVIDCDGVPQELPMPPFLIQPLVENAVAHGLEPQPAGGEVRVTIAQDEARLSVEVADDGAGLPAQPGKGIGLANVRERLETLYPGNVMWSLTANAPRGSVARFEIPLART